ncbi:MAG: chemotaxis response regulator protein-glutamate methylesterase [Deltaproteobacteria bacterium]|nr:chemotaxis response regulator protein-glutamate methylesterase [Deltaproteobacteria bacterium]
MSSSNIRVLVAEDSPTARALLVAMLSASSGIEVIGEARDGLEAVELTLRLKPDVVTMDIQMPQLDGYEATRRIMTEHPTPIVIVSSLDVLAVEVSMEALRAGAVDVVPKPEGPSSPGHAQAARYLAATVRAMAGIKLVRRWPAPQDVARPTPVGSRPLAVPPRVVALAASTGGPAALHQVFSAIPADFPLPLLIVQHMASGFTEGFAAWLDGSAKVKVKVARAGEPLQPGVAYVAPDDRHLGVSKRGTVALSDVPLVGGFRPSGTLLFQSVASSYGAASIAVILTGMGSDGLAGVRELKAAGGRVIAQDEATSEIFGMPGVVVEARIADSVLPIGAIGGEITRLCMPG